MTSAPMRAPLADHLRTPQNASPPARTANPLAQGRQDRMHLWVGQKRGHAGCFDTSPGKHAAAHFRLAGHPVILSYEPSEDWYWCYLDQFVFELQGARRHRPSRDRSSRTDVDVRLRR